MPKRLRKIEKGEICPPSWCPSSENEGCCFVCEFHVEKGKYIPYCGHSQAFKKSIMINKKFFHLIKSIALTLDYNGLKWVLGGSTGLSLQGIKIRPRDIDIFTDKKNVFRINRALKEFEIKPVKFSKSNSVQSYLGEFRVNNIKVEVMGDFKIKVKNKWIPRTLSSKKVLFGGMKIPVTPIKDQIKSYKMLGRNKDLLKIKKIKRKFLI